MNPPHRQLFAFPTTVVAAVVIALLATRSVAQEPEAAKPQPTLQELQRRVDEQGAMLKELIKQQQDQQAKPATSGFEMKYDKGYVMRSTDAANPFELRITRSRSSAGDSSSAGPGSTRGCTSTSTSTPTRMTATS